MSMSMHHTHARAERIIIIQFTSKTVVEYLYFIILIVQF